MILDVVVIEQMEILSKRRFQPWITLTYVQRVAIVGNIQQIAHRRLTCVSPVVKA